MKLLTKLLVVAMMAMTTTCAATPAPAGTLSIAKKYVGLHERRNSRAIKALIGVNPARTPWCGFFVSSVVRKTGKRPPAGPGLAKSWSRYGKKVSRSAARAGDIVVVRNRRGYHVGILVSMNRGKVTLIGGNQSNRVQASSYPAARIVSIRR